ncbi:unnamed protein product [Anisakis simplex]|uniref:Uncharacterized protein n=1 Tax=Anisakis simplex TaxID=6269 RepID=A0A0M3J0P3_ANISI|nr:unnamed protein product [Anisakis simplex]
MIRDQNELGKFLIECTSLPCTGDRFAGISGVPQCPRTTLFCFGATEDENAQFPKALRNFPTVSVTSPFPINVTRYKISEEEKAITTMCEQRCNLGIEEDIQEPQYTLISLRTTIILAIVSLLIGVCFAAGIWFIHIRTQGKTKRHLRREELSRIPIVAEADAHAA